MYTKTIFFRSLLICFLPICIFAKSPPLESDANKHLERLQNRLWLAGVGDDVDLACASLAGGVPVNYADEDGWRALHFAAIHGSLAAAEFLLLNGAEVDAREYDNNNTPLHLASLDGDVEMAKLLLKHGADIHAKNSGQDDPLLLAASECHSIYIEFLLGQGANIHSADSNGYTVLHYAAENGCEEVIELCLKKGIAIDAADDDGYAAIHIAVLRDQPEIIECLIDAGADVNLKTSGDDYQLTPLHLAISCRKERIAKLLLAYGASIDIDPIEDMTTLEYANEMCGNRFCQFLLSRG